MFREQFGTGDDAWLAECRQAHGLCRIELRVLECGQSCDAVYENRRELRSVDIDLISQHDLGRARKQTLLHREGRRPARSRADRAHGLFLRADRRGARDDGRGCLYAEPPSVGAAAREGRQSARDAVSRAAENRIAIDQWTTAITAVQPAVLTEECGPVTSSVVKFAVDSLLEGDGFELPVPRQRRHPSPTAG
jgi:hypothetical protein